MMSTGALAAAPIHRLSRRVPSGGAAMGSSTTTTPASRDDGLARRPESTSRALRLALQLVLGTVGFAGFALLGAGGAWLFKHYVAGSPSAGTPSAQVAPAARVRPDAASPVASPAWPVAPPVQAVAAPPEASAAGPQAATPALALPERDPTLDAPPAAGRSTSHASTKPARGIDPRAPATAERADRAACLARVNAITADLSLRNEPPTPEQLAILKKGCK